MDSFPLQTIGGLDPLATLFNALATVFQGSLVQAFTVLATSVGAVSAMLYAIWRNELKPLSSWFVSYHILVLVLFSPVARVHISDTLTGRFQSIDHVPFALALTASTLSTLSLALTQKLEQVMQPLPQSQAGSGSSSDTAFHATLTYSQTGFMFGAQALMQMRNIQITNHDMAQNMKEFVNQCVVYGALNGNRFTLEDLQKTGDIWGLISENPSKLLGFAWRQVERDSNGKFLRSLGTEIISCADGVRRFNTLWAQATEHALTSLYTKMGEALGIPSSNSSHTPLSSCAATYFPGALNKFTHQAQSASDRIRQQMMMSTVLKSTLQKTQELGGHPNFEATRAYFQQRQTYQTLGETVSQTLLSLKNVLEALSYALFIFVSLVALLPHGWKIILFWIKVIAWIQLWPPLFSILNFLVSEYMALSITSQVGLASGISLWSFVGIMNTAADMSATAGYLSCLIPILAWALLDQGGYAFVSMASQLLGVSQGAATTAALEKVTGNYTFGNVSLDGIQSDHTNLFKHDTSAAYSGGHFSVQDGASSRLISANGEQIVNRNLSQLPVTIHGSEAQEHVYRTLASEAESLSVSESEQATQSQQAMASDYLQIGKHASHMIQSGEQFSHQETASSLQEAARAYNQAKRIAQEFGISEELVNQKLAEASTGMNVSIDPVALGPIHLSGNLGGNLGKQEMSSARASQAEHVIQELGQSDDFRRSLQHGYQSFQGRTFDTTNQNLKESIQNYSSNYEKAVSHQHNAAKAYDASKSLQNEMGMSRSKSFMIDSNYSQDFVNHVGAEGLEHMSTEEMQKQAQAFMAQKVQNLESGLRHRYALKEQYEEALLPSNMKTPKIIQQENTARIRADSAQIGAIFESSFFDDPKIQATQMLNMAQHQARRTHGQFEDVYVGRKGEFDKSVETHAHDEMGILQEGATQDMYQSFKKEEPKKFVLEEYAATNVGSK